MKNFSDVEHIMITLSELLPEDEHTETLSEIWEDLSELEEKNKAMNKALSVPRGY